MIILYKQRYLMISLICICMVSIYGTENPFTDVAADAYYADAVLWAVKEEITEGTTTTTFSPADDCTRAQIVTFLYRYLSK